MLSYPCCRRGYEKLQVLRDPAEWLIHEKSMTLHDEDGAQYSFTNAGRNVEQLPGGLG